MSYGNFGSDSKKQETFNKFKKLYIEFLRNEKDVKEVIRLNQNALEELKSEFNLDNKSIDFLPGFFNYIECHLEMRNIPEVKKYLIVGLSNLMFSNKKSDESKEDEAVDMEEDEDIIKEKKNLRSRLDLLFARFNLAIKKYGESIEKLTNSIILYSEIYGPESVGLTPHYYYLANYFAEKPFEGNDTQELREIIIRNIYLKIADIWRKQFLGEKNENFELNVDNNLNLIVGEYYVKKILAKCRANFSTDKELELKFKILRVLILKELGSELYRETLNQVLKIIDMYKIGDESFLQDLHDKLN